jgi:enoyl-CoA hydratase/carnithine racemase
MSEAEPELTGAMWTGLVRRPDYEEYSVKYRDFFAMRRQDGIIELRMHRDGGSYYQTMASHNAWGQAWQEVGNDPLNQVLILTGTGEKWFDGQRGAEARFARTTADIAKTYEDAAKLLENFVFGVDIPTIAAVNGPGLHTEIALACDITICTEGTSFSTRTSCCPPPPATGRAWRSRS